MSPEEGFSRFGNSENFGVPKFSDDHRAGYLYEPTVRDSLFYVGRSGRPNSQRYPRLSGPEP
jgi:hypothetical protein